MIVREVQRVSEAERWDGISGPNDPTTPRALCWKTDVNHDHVVPHVHEFGSPATGANGTPMWLIAAGDWVVSDPEPGTYFQVTNRVLHDADFRRRFESVP